VAGIIKKLLRGLHSTRLPSVGAFKHGPAESSNVSASKYQGSLRHDPSSTTLVQNDNSTDSWRREDFPRGRSSRSPRALKHIASGTHVSRFTFILCTTPMLMQCRSVIWKLMSFTFAMITLPIGTYFFSVSYVFRGKLHQTIHLQSVTDFGTGNATYAGGLAALMANVVLIAYVVMAFKDDQAEQAEEAEKSKKEL
jgi:hypothetical protein